MRRFVGIVAAAFLALLMVAGPAAATVDRPPEPSGEAARLVCYPKGDDVGNALDEMLLGYGIVINQLCVGNPPGTSRIQVDANLKYESGTVTGGPEYTCEEYRPAGDQTFGDLKVKHCYGKPGPAANFTTQVVVCVRLDSFGTTVACP